MAGFDVSLERMLDASGQETWMAKLASDSFEVNVEAPLEDLLRLEGINSATWEAGRSLGVGTCLGQPVFWCPAGEGHGDEANLLIGHDDETWEVAVTVPLAIVEDLVSQARVAPEDG